MNILNIGLVSVSDRAVNNIYKDQGIPTLKKWLSDALITPFKIETRLVPDDQIIIEQTLCELVDNFYCGLVLTTGGTGPAICDVTPEATLAIADRVIPGFGEQMRQISLRFVPTAILSRQVGVIRKKSLIINLPGQPVAIIEILQGLKSKNDLVNTPGIFACIPYCLEIINGQFIETNPKIIISFRPKKTPNSK